MKYKVGDEIRIKGTDIGGTIERIIRGQLIVETKGSKIPVWPEEVVLIEGLVEEETKPEPKFKVGDSVEVLKSGNVYTISQMKFNGKEFVYTLSNNGSTVSCFSEEEIEFTEEDKYWCDIMSKSDPTTYVLPQGYQFVDENGNVINTQKIILEKKKKEYPKTYEECINILGGAPIIDINTYYYEKQLKTLYKLLICRDAYWKIAGEEKGLDKPWSPTHKDSVFSIGRIHGKIITGCHLGECVTFEFPTSAMRDAFKENFDPDIEFCKELL